MIDRDEYLKKVRQSRVYQRASLTERKRILAEANKRYDRRLEREKEDALNEEVYDSINNLEITDVFQNFEDKYGKDNTTELTTFKDLHQKDAFPPHGKDRANLFKAVHERDKNIGVEHQVFKNANKQKRMCEEMNTNISLFTEGYLAALNEACSCGSKKCPVCSKKKKIINDCGISCNEEDKIFMKGYYDAINEMTEIDSYGDEYDYDEHNEYDELSDIDEDDIKHSYN